jgi:hypothetical protein
MLVRNNPVFFQWITKIKTQSLFFSKIPNKKIRVRLIGWEIRYNIFENCMMLKLWWTKLLIRIINIIVGATTHKILGLL